jgi:hypothetical protein
MGYSSKICKPCAIIDNFRCVQLVYVFVLYAIFGACLRICAMNERSVSGTLYISSHSA